MGTGEMDELKGKRIGEILVSLGILDGLRLNEALEYSKAWMVPFGQACVDLGYCTEDDVVRAVAIQMGAPAVRLDGFTVAGEVLARVPRTVAARCRVMPVAVTPSPGGGRPTLVVAVSRPRDIAVWDDLAFSTQCRISMVVTSDSDLDAALVRFYGVDPTVHGGASTEEESAPGIAHLVDGYFDLKTK